MLHHTMYRRRHTGAWKFVRPLGGRSGWQWRARTRRNSRRSDWVVILATGGPRSGYDVLVRVDVCGGNSFTISVLEWGVGGSNTKIRWRERGSRGKGFSNFELAGDLKRLSFSCGLLLFKLLLLPSFELLRSASGGTSFFESLFLTIGSSRCVAISIVVVVVVAACRFALRVFLFARFSRRGSCIFSAD